MSKSIQNHIYFYTYNYVYQLHTNYQYEFFSQQTLFCKSNQETLHELLKFSGFQKYYNTVIMFIYNALVAEKNIFYS